MMDRISGRVALLVVVVASLLVVLLGWFVLISPEKSKADKLDAQISDTNTQLAAVTSLLDGPAGRSSLVTARLFQKAIPDDARVSQILRQLSAAAAQSGVELDATSPQPLLPGAGSETLPISLTVKGHYFGLQNFLRLLRTSADLRDGQVKATGRLFTVGGIQFSGTQPTQGQTATAGRSSLIQATVALNAFVYSPTSAVAPAVAPTTTSTSAAGATP